MSLIIKELAKNSVRQMHILQDMQEVGFVDFWTLSVAMPILKLRDVAGLSANDLKAKSSLTIDEYSKLEKVLPLAVHEYTHFLDFTSTLWGMKHLLGLSRCIDTPEDERKFHVFKSFHDHVRKIRLPKYYFVINENEDAAGKWTAYSTSGVMFNNQGFVTDEPIFFINFFNKDGKHLARSPISTVSLLEASAMSGEILSRISLVRRLSGNDRLVENHILQRKILRDVYDHTTTEYSVCFHFLANVLNISDLALVARFVEKLVRLIFNMPDKAYTSASKNVHVYARLFGFDSGSPEVVRLRNALVNINMGAMYFFIVVFLGQSKYRSGLGFFNFDHFFYLMIEDALGKIGLRLSKIQYSSNFQIGDVHKDIAGCKSPAIRAIAKAGVGNFKKSHRNGVYDFSDLSLPCAFIDDDDFFFFNKSLSNELLNYDVGFEYLELVKNQIRVENFVEACI